MASFSEITLLLGRTLSPFDNVRKRAENELNDLRGRDVSQFLLALGAEVSNEVKPIECRQAAAIRLKNEMSCLKNEIKEWGKIDISVKSQIKECLLRTMESPVREVRRLAALAVGVIASCDIRRNEWQELVPSFMLGDMGQLDGIPILIEAKLDVLGYVCEEIPSRKAFERAQESSIVAAIVGAMGGEQNYTVRVSACKALCKAIALGLARDHLRNEKDMGNMMRAICDAASLEKDEEIGEFTIEELEEKIAHRLNIIREEIDLRKAAFDCLLSISTRYRDVLEDYLDRIFNLTDITLCEDEEVVRVVALQFWVSIGENECRSYELRYFRDHYGSIITMFGGALDDDYGTVKTFVRAALLPRNVNPEAEDSNFAWSFAELFRIMYAVVGSKKMSREFARGVNFSRRPNSLLLRMREQVARLAGADNL